MHFGGFSFRKCCFRSFQVITLTLVDSSSWREGKVVVKRGKDGGKVSVGGEPSSSSRLSGRCKGLLFFRLIYSARKTYLPRLRPPTTSRTSRVGHRGTRTYLCVWVSPSRTRRWGAGGRRGSPTLLGGAAAWWQGAGAVARVAAEATEEAVEARVAAEEEEKRVE